MQFFSSSSSLATKLFYALFVKLHTSRFITFKNSASKCWFEVAVVFLPGHYHDIRQPGLLAAPEQEISAQ